MAQIRQQSHADPDSPRAVLALTIRPWARVAVNERVRLVLGDSECAARAAVWDVHHPYRMGEAVEDMWDFVGARLAHVHMKDARRREDGSWELKLMGEGEVPCREILDLIASRGYNGFVCAEWEKKWHPEIEEPEIALPQHARVLRDWMAGGNG